jgi:hypothetical protein
MSARRREVKQPRTLKGVLALRAAQDSFRRIADDKALRHSAREAAQRQIDAIEAEIRRG